MKPANAIFCLLLMGGGLAATTTTVWNPIANGIAPPDAGSWSDGANWVGGQVPDGDWKAVLNLPDAAECVLDTAVTVTQLVTGDQSPGSTLRLADGAELTCTDWGGPFNRSSLIIVESGAKAVFQTKLLIGQFDDPGEHQMEFRMDGGEVEVGTVVRIGESFDDTNVVPRIRINGGVLTANELDLDRGLTDITWGTIALRTDQTVVVQGFIDSGVLTAFGGTGTVVHDWDIRNPGFHTITAIPSGLPGADAPLKLEPTPSPPGTEGHFTSGSEAGRSVWIAEEKLYFNIPPNTFPIGAPVYVRIEYVDRDRGRLSIQYDSDLGDGQQDKFRPSEIHTRSDRVDGGGLAFSYHQLADPRFADRQNGGNDFRINLDHRGGEPFRIAAVSLSSDPFPDPTFAYSLSRPWLGPYQGDTKDFVDATTSSGKVMTGYQGWFAAPNDPDDAGWFHWGRSSSRDPSPTEITIDQWPWLDDYEPEQLYPAGDMTLSDGRPAYLFSSRDPETVRRHFRWMRRHDIDGAYLQRFVSRSASGAYGAPEFVLHNVRRAANLEGRVWAIEYDVSSLQHDSNPFEVITNDWNWLVNEVDILNDPRYLHHDGKPVLFIWGFSVPGREGLDLPVANAILDWFNLQDLHLIAGVHSSWLGNADWHGHYRKYDQLLAWMERDPARLAAQKAKLDEWEMTILPHAWPGFSWHNLQQLVPFDQYTARSGGAFYWERLLNATDVGADQIFLGMFDEYDEGTALMPMSDLTPQPHTDWGHYIDNETLDPFWYLQLSAAAREMLNGYRPPTAALPPPLDVPLPIPGGEDSTVHLGSVDQEDGLSHVQVGDGLTQPALVANHECRTIETGLYLYFDLDDDIPIGSEAGHELMIEVEFHDSEAGARLSLQYDGVAQPYANHPQDFLTSGSNLWQRARWQVTDAIFGGRQNNGADFRIAQFDGSNLPIRRVSAVFPEERTEQPPHRPALTWHETGLEWSGRADATGWRLYRSGNLQEGSWSRVIDALIFADGTVNHSPALNGKEFFRLQRPARR